MEILKRIALILALFACVAGARSAFFYAWKTPCDCLPVNASRADRIARLVIFTSPSCHWCDKLKADWPEGFPCEHEWRQTTPEDARKHRIEGVPTLILFDKDGAEIDRQSGYLSKAELARWLERNDDGHCPDPECER